MFHKFHSDFQTKLHSLNSTRKFKELEINAKGGNTLDMKLIGCNKILAVTKQWQKWLISTMINAKATIIDCSCKRA